MLLGEILGEEAQVKDVGVDGVDYKTRVVRKL